MELIKSPVNWSWLRQKSNKVCIFFINIKSPFRPKFAFWLLNMIVGYLL